MDNDILKLIKMITLLYLASRHEKNRGYVYETIRNNIKTIKVDSRALMGVGSIESIIESLRDTVEWMLCSNGAVIEQNELVNRLRINCLDNPEYMAIIEKTLLVEIPEEKIESRINSILGELKFMDKKNKCKSTIRKANGFLNFSGEYVELDPYLEDLIGELTEIKSSNSSNIMDLPGLVDIVDFGNESEIVKVLEKMTKLYDPSCMINTGLIGLNRALGGHGIIRGWLYNVGAVSFGYKTGHLLDLTLNIPRFNKPWLLDPTKKPLYIRFTFETSVAQDTKILYQKAKFFETGIKVPINKIDVHEASYYLKNYFESNGYKFVLAHFDPSDFTVYHLIRALDHYISQGYEIQVCNVDYLGKIAKNTIAPREDLKLPLTFELWRSYCHARGITQITGAQLGPEARALAKENPVGCTSKFAEGSWYADSKSLYNELDIETLSHVVKHVDGNTYWSLSRGKHRDHDETPLEHRSFYYKFEKGGIPPDFGGECKAIYKLPNAGYNSNVDYFD